MKNSFIRGLRYVCAFPFYVVLFVLMVVFLIIFSVAMLIGGFADTISGRNKEDNSQVRAKLLKVLDILQQEDNEDSGDNSNDVDINSTLIL